MVKCGFPESFKFVIQPTPGEGENDIEAGQEDVQWMRLISKLKMERWIYRGKRVYWVRGESKRAGAPSYQDENGEKWLKPSAANQPSLMDMNMTRTITGPDADDQIQVAEYEYMDAVEKKYI